MSEILKPLLTNLQAKILIEHIKSDIHPEQYQDTRIKEWMEGFKHGQEMALECIRFWNQNGIGRTEDEADNSSCEER